MASRIKEKIKTALKKEFIKNVLQLLSGTAGAQIVAIISLPILSYFYTPKHFDVLALFIASTSFIGVALAGRFEFSLMLPEEESEGLGLLILSILSATFVTILLTGTLLIFRDYVPLYYNEIPLHKFVLLIPLGAFFHSINGIGEKWCTRKKKFKKIARAKIIYSLLIVALQFALLKTGGLGLICSYLSGLGVSICLLYREAWIDFSKRKRNRISRNYFALIKTYWRFPAYSAPSGLISQVAHQLPSFALPYFGSGVLGNYSMGYKILNAPLGFLGTSISNVFFQKISRVRDNPDQANRLLKKAYLSLFLIILPPMIALFFWGEPIIKMVFGNKWDDVGLYLKLLIPFLMLRFIVSPTALSMQALDKQSTVLIWMITYMGTSLFVFWWGINNSNATTTILTYSIVSAIMYAIWVALSLNLKNYTDQ